MVYLYTLNSNQLDPFASKLTISTLVNVICHSEHYGQLPKTIIY